MAARLESTNEKIVEILKTQLPKNLTLLGSKYRCSNGWYCGKPRKCRTRKIPLESLYVECYLARIQFFLLKVWSRTWTACPSNGAVETCTIVQSSKIERDNAITRAIDKLTQFKMVSSNESPISLQRLKDELPVFRALANDINANLFDMESILPLF